MPSAPQIEFEEHRLNNGLSVLLHRDDRVPLVHVSVHYRVGSSYEKVGRSGLAHLFEHMMFQGSENIAKNEHGGYIDNAGGTWNASTNKDRTNYFDTVPSHYLDLALWLEADRMRSLKVTQENFENQLQTVIEEKKQSYDNRPYGLAYLRFDELAYENWAYAHPVIGSVEDLQNTTLEDALQFHGTYYGPGTAILVLSGDFEDKVLDRVNHHFAAIADQTTPDSFDLSEPRQREEKTETLKDPLAPLPAVSLGYHMAATGTPEYYALSVLAFLLAQGESSRLYRLLVHDHNWVTNLSVGPNQYKGPQLFQIWFQLQSGVKTETVLGALEEELGKICGEGVLERELEKARNQIAFGFVNRLSKVSQIGELMAHYALYHEDPEMINQDLNRHLEVDRDQIIEAAEKVFNNENRTLVLVDPGKE